MSGHNSHRLALMAFPPVMILIGICLEEIKSRFGAIAFIIALALVLIAAIIPFWQLGTRMRPLIKTEEVPIFLEVKESVPENSIIIVPHWGLRYWVEYLTGLEVELRPTPEVVKSGQPIYAFVERRDIAKLGPRFKLLWRQGRFSLYEFLKPPPLTGAAGAGNPNGILEEFQQDFPGKKILDAREFRGDFWRMYIQAREENALVVIPKEAFKLNLLLQDLFVVCAERRGFLLLEPRLGIAPPPRPPRPPAGAVTVADTLIIVFAFPAQLFNYLNVPMKAVIKAAVGLPLTFLLWGFVIGKLGLLSRTGRRIRKALRLKLKR